MGCTFSLSVDKLWMKHPFSWVLFLLNKFSSGWYVEMRGVVPEKFSPFFCSDDKISPLKILFDMRTTVSFFAFWIALIDSICWL